MNSENGDNTFHQRLAELIGGEEPYAWARRMGIPSGTFARIYPDGTIPKAEHLTRIADGAGVTLDWLLLGRGPKYHEGGRTRPAPASGFDRELFTECVHAIEEVMEEMGKKVSRERRIELFFALYDLEMAERAHGRPGASGAQIIRLVRNAA